MPGGRATFGSGSHRIPPIAAGFLWSAGGKWLDSQSQGILEPLQCSLCLVCRIHAFFPPILLIGSVCPSGSLSSHVNLSLFECSRTLMCSVFISVFAFISSIVVTVRHVCEIDKCDKCYMTMSVNVSESVVDTKRCEFVTRCE